MNETMIDAVADSVEVPVFWTSATLRDICKLRQEQVDPAGTDVKVYVGLEHIEPGNPTLTIHGSPSDVRSAKSRFYSGDLLYGKLRPYLDKAVSADRDGICSTDILVLTPNAERSDGQFLINVLHTPRFVQLAVRTTHGLNHPRTSWQSIGEYTLALPPIGEQRAIAAVLGKLQAAVAAQQAIIDRMAELKSALMAKLFTEGTVGEPTKDSRIGPIPESWTVCACNEICAQISVGIVVRPAQYYRPDGIPCFRSANVRPDVLDESNLVFISEAANARLAKSILRTGDVLIVRTGYPGTSCVVPAKYDGTNCIDLIFARCKSSMNSQYLSRFLNSPMGQRQVIVGNNSAQQHFNVGAVKSLLVPIPSRSEQNEIVSTLEVIDSRIQAASATQQLSEELFAAMLDELMTGRIRVNDLDLAACGT